MPELTQVSLGKPDNRTRFRSLGTWVVTSGHDGTEAQHILHGGHREAGTHGIQESYYIPQVVYCTCVVPPHRQQQSPGHPARIYQTCMKCRVWCYNPGEGGGAESNDLRVSRHTYVQAAGFSDLGNEMRSFQFSDECLQLLTQ